MARKAIIQGTNLITMFFVSLVACAQKGPDATVSLPDTACSIHGAMKIIENRTGFRFSYNSDLFDDSKMCRLEAGSRSVTGIIGELIPDPGIRFRIISNQIVLYRPDLRIIEKNSSGRDTTKSWLFIRGTLLDASSKDPVPYASIGLIGKNSGSISNLSGHFLLKTGTESIEDSIGVWSLGYQNYMAPVFSLIGKDNTIYLSPEYISIQEVIIRKTDPVALVSTALDRIPQNYPVRATGQTAFYRETIQKNKQYVEVSEAILDIYKPSYIAESERERVRIIRGRKGTDPELKDTVSLKLKAGLNTSLILDVVRNRPDFLNKETMDHYWYRMSDVVMKGNRTTYAIDFIQREETLPPHYQGRIFIDAESLAITDVDFEIVPGKIGQATGYLVLRKPRGMSVRALSASYHASYEKTGHLYFLRLIRSENRFRTRYKGQLFGSTYSARSELAVNDIDTTDVIRFRRRESARVGDAFSDLIEGTDLSFWDPYNIIVPDEPLEKAMARFRMSAGEE